MRGGWKGGGKEAWLVTAGAVSCIDLVTVIGVGFTTNDLHAFGRHAESDAMAKRIIALVRGCWRVAYRINEMSFGCPSEGASEAAWAQLLGVRRWKPCQSLIVRKPHLDEFVCFGLESENGGVRIKPFVSVDGYDLAGRTPKHLRMRTKRLRIAARRVARPRQPTNDAVARKLSNQNSRELAIIALELIALKRRSVLVGPEHDLVTLGWRCASLE